MGEQELFVGNTKWEAGFPIFKLEYDLLGNVVEEEDQLFNYLNAGGINRLVTMRHLAEALSVDIHVLNITNLKEETPSSYTMYNIVQFFKKWENNV